MKRRQIARARKIITLIMEDRLWLATFKRRFAKRLLEVVSISVSILLLALALPESSGIQYATKIIYIVTNLGNIALGFLKFNLDHLEVRRKSLDMRLRSY